MTPESPVLNTKLHLPRPDGRQVKRPRLFHLLEASPRCRLTVVSAPPGFGKTSAVAAWLASRRDAPHVAWLSLDEGDNDPVRFWSHFLRALGGVLGDYQERARAYLETPLPSYRALVEGLLNALSAHEAPLVLVLDDVHALSHPPLLDALAQLVEHLPEAMRLVLITRADPPLPLARLRAQGMLNEVRAEDLRFTDAEAEGFLQATMGLDLEAADRSSLLGKTEGWIAGLQLAALSLQRANDPRAFITAFAGTNRYVMDYLAEEALSLQAEPIQRFLMETCVLSRFDASLCEVLTGRADSQEVLESLEQANLFLVPLDAERHWYRYHHLFADMLRHQLQKRHPGRAEALHAVASRHFESQNQPAEAIAHALKAQDWGRAGDLVISADALLRRGEVATLLSFLKAIPESAFEQRADLNLLLAWLLFPTGQGEALKRLLSRAERVQAPGDEARLLAVRSFLGRIEGRFEEAVGFAREALARLDPEDWVWHGAVSLTLAACLQLADRLVEAEGAYDRAIEGFGRQGDVFFAIMAQGLKGGLLADLGRLSEAQALLEGTLSGAEVRAGRGWPPISYALSALAGVHALRGQMESAIRLAEEGLAAGEGFVEPTLNSLYALAAVRLRARHGEAAEAERLLERARQAASRHRVSYLEGYFEAQHALASGASGPSQREAFARWEGAMGARLRSGAPHWPLRDGRRLLARICLVAGRSAEAIALLEQAEADARQAGRLPLLIAAQAARAMALAEAGRADDAQALLEETLEAAEPEGILAPFLEAGEPMRRLLEAWSRRMPNHPLASFAKCLLPEAPDDADMVEPLSAREREVLALIAEGLSNHAIAERLGIELSTVKRHSSNILGKLGASNRTQAAAFGRSRGWF